MNENTSTAPIPADDLKRNLTLAQPDKSKSLPHIGLVGATYTILLTGADTAGRYCLIDMHIPPGGGPPPHRHDFEESFTMLEGELDVTFRGAKAVLRTGDTLNIPANAPHQFPQLVIESSTAVMHLLVSGGREEFFQEVGTPVASRTTAPDELDQAAQAALKAKSAALAPKYRTQLLDTAV